MQADVEKQSGEAKDTVAQIQAQAVDMAADPEKLRHWAQLREKWHNVIRMCYGKQRECTEW